MPRNEHFAYNLVEHDCGTVTTLKHSKICKLTLVCIDSSSVKMTFIAPISV